jgi:dihydrofolate reductase
MNITLMLTIDANHTIGDGTKIPWDCTEIHKAMESVIKGKTIILGKNAYNELSCFHRTRVSGRIIFSGNFKAKQKNTAYTNNVYTALAMAKKIGNDVFILGGNQTARSFLSEGLITKIMLYSVSSSHDGIKFINSGPGNFSLTHVEKKSGYSIEYYSSIPASILPTTPIDNFDSPKLPSEKITDKIIDRRNIRNPYSEDYSIADNMLKSVFSDYNQSDEDGDVLDPPNEFAIVELAGKMDEIYDILGKYGSNQSQVVDKLNKVIVQDRSVVSCIASMGDRIGAIEADVHKTNIPIICISLSILAIILGIAGIVF